MTFAQSLLAARERALLSPFSAANLLGVSMRTIYAWEAGYPIPSTATQEGALAILARYAPKKKSREIAK